MIKKELNDEGKRLFKSLVDIGNKLQKEITKVKNGYENADTLFYGRNIIINVF